MKPAYAILLISSLWSVNSLANDSPQHDYPTQARVEYVFGCMQQLGGENYDNLYKCSCSIDRIADQVSYEDFVAMDTFARGQRAGGERPEVLREGRQAESSRSTFAKVKHRAATQCLIDDTDHS
ncbi:hypothetical protein GCM10027040_15690 [Halomonas shantousis]